MSQKSRKIRSNSCPDEHHIHEVVENKKGSLGGPELTKRGQERTSKGSETEEQVSLSPEKAESSGQKILVNSAIQVISPFFKLAFRDVY